MNPDRWQRVEECYHAALEQPPSERAGFIAQACANDAEMRREVESLLAHEGQADELLENPAWQHVTPPDETGTMAPGVLSAGLMMAQYRIAGKLGAGGMGEVYRATDTKLQREVALKVLAACFAHDAAWLSRFQREALILASLSHPHIAAVYGLEESGGVRAIAMELVEGPTLAERIARGRLAIPEALAIAKQIAEALEYAHEKGIVHRDLKPANVKLRPDGVVKVLDFGLAKAKDTDAGATSTATGVGIILGTPAYMPPEQAAGNPVDRRADIWAFGVVLFEMLAGRPLYVRKTTQETLAAVARDQPEWDELPAQTPAAIVRLLRRCLDKDAKRRLRDIGEARVVLEEDRLEETGSASTSSRHRPLRGRLWLYGATAAVALIAGALAGVRLALPPIDLSQQRHRLVVSRTDNFAVPRWAPDGKSFVYNDSDYVTVQSLDAATPSAVLRDTSDVPTPFFSPDGSRLYFTSGSSGRSVWMGSTAGGEPQPLVKDLGGPYMLDGAGLSRDGQSLLVAKVTGDATRLYLSSPPGAPLQPLPGALPLPANSSRIRLRFSHDGGKLLVMAVGARISEESHMWILPWPPGRGPARQIQKALQLDGAHSSADWLLDNRHLIVAAVPARSIGGRFLLVDTESDESYPLTPNNSNVAYPSVGPDGRILYSQVSTAYDLVQVPIDGSAPADLLATDWIERFGAWSRDGSEFVYVSDRSGEEGLWIASANGSWKRQVVDRQDITPGAGATFRSPEFSPDGKRLAYVGGRRVWVSPASGGRPTAVTPANETATTPTWSADGNWIAYREGATLKKVQVGSGAAPVPISRTEAVPVFWSPDGKWITLGFDGGIGVVSPDGSQKRLLIHKPFAGFFASLGWSRDSAVLYLLDRVRDHYRLSAFDIARGSERVIRDYPPSNFNYSELTLACARLYPSGDGKSLLAPRWSVGSSVWLLEGVEPPRGLWRRLLHR